MRWSSPEFVEVKMDAEIGSYQQDDERGDLPFANVATKDNLDADVAS
jgi:hypothetical protein